MIRVPMCPELTVERVLKQVQGHMEIMRFLPDLTDNGKQYIERLSVCNRQYHRQKLLPRIDGRNRDEKSKKATQGEQGMIEIERNLFGLLQQV